MTRRGFQAPGGTVAVQPGEGRALAALLTPLREAEAEVKAAGFEPDYKHSPPHGDLYWRRRLTLCSLNEALLIARGEAS